MGRFIASRGSATRMDRAREEIRIAHRSTIYVRRRVDGRKYTQRNGEQSGDALRQEDPLARNEIARSAKQGRLPAPPTMDVRRCSGYRPVICRGAGSPPDEGPAPRRRTDQYLRYGPDDSSRTQDTVLAANYTTRSRTLGEPSTETSAGLSATVAPKATTL